MKRQAIRNAGYWYGEAKKLKEEKEVLKKLPELLNVIEELDIVNISFTPSPVGGNSVVEKMDHAINMLKNFRDFKKGLLDTGVKEIFFEEC